MSIQLDGVVAGFTSTDANCFLYRENKYLSVADFAGIGCLRNGFDRLFKSAVFHYDFNFEFWQKIHHILCTTVQFCMAFLSSKTFYFRYGIP